MRFKSLIRLILAGSCIISFSYPVFAEFYRYTDENGVVRFTDNMLEVPEAQRKAAGRYSESTSSDDNNTGGNNAEVTTEEKADTSVKKEGGKKASEVMYEEYVNLQSEREALEREFKEKESKFTPEELKGYNDRVKSYNDRLTDYERKRESLEKIDAEMKATKEAAIKAVIEEEKKEQVENQ